MPFREKFEKLRHSSDGLNRYQDYENWIKFHLGQKRENDPELSKPNFLLRMIEWTDYLVDMHNLGVENGHEKLNEKYIEERTFNKSVLLDMLESSSEKIYKDYISGKTENEEFSIRHQQFLLIKLMPMTGISL